MPTLFDTVELLVGRDAFDETLPPMPIFDTQVLDFLDELGRRLLADPNSRVYPELAAFGFWCRRSSLLEQKGSYDDGTLRLGRGLVFHVAPSNVPLNFAYSLAAGLLSGNANVVRLPSRGFEQAGLLCGHMQALLEDRFPALLPYITCIRYDRENRELTGALSALCDGRVLWGGDGTIAAIREHPTKPRCVEVGFADRYSVCVIHSETYLDRADPGILARQFYNDTYLSDQLACTSPCLVYWLGNRVTEACARFWRALYPLVREAYPLQGVQAVAKLTAFQTLAATHPELKLEAGDNLLTRVWAPVLTPDLTGHRPGSGFFLESAGELVGLLPVLGNRCQTLACFGLELEEITAFLQTHRPRGIDRIVPIGQTMDFSLTWDGVDLIHTLSREIEFRSMNSQS